MVKVRFLADHDHSPPALGGRVTIAYKAGTVETVTRACADEAETLGRIKRLDERKGRRAPPET